VGALKGIWIFRVVFYGVALAFIAVHFWPDGKSVAADVRPLEGWTSQGRAVELTVGRRGVTALDMDFRVPCGDGTAQFERWYPAEGAPVHFQNRGHAFFVREKDTMADSWMTGHVAADGSSASGLTHMTTRYGNHLCDSGLVRWSVHRRPRS
jgi:hypothetical protein